MKRQMILAILMFSFSFPALAAVGTGKALIKVTTGIQIAKTSDLVFSEAMAGASAETVTAGTTETAQNASFNVSGEPNKAITIVLPADNTVVMKKGVGGSSDTEISVNNFTSNNPSAIGSNGSVALFVGATREALDLNQQPGDYAADFQVDVVY